VETAESQRPGLLETRRQVYIEYWAFVGMVHLYRQFGIDLFEQVHEHIAQQR